MSGIETSPNPAAGKQHQRSQRHGNGNARVHLPHWAEEKVEERPLTSLCTVFAAGFVLGAGAVAAACSVTSQVMAPKTPTEKLGERLADAISKALPAKLSDAMFR